MERLGVDPSLRSAFLTMLEFLESDGYLERLDDRDWEVRRHLAPTPATQLVRDLVAEYPEAAMKVRLVVRCGEELASIFRGRTSPLEVVFSDRESLEAYYRESPEARFLNLTVEQAVAEIARASDDRLELLEVGAGTGSTTRHVLPHLAPNRARYVFTDVSPAFLSRAEQSFPSYEFVEYRRFDIDEDPPPDLASRFDVVIAANSLHTCSVVADTARRLRSILRPGGIAIIAELTRSTRFLDATFGLLDGWWRFSQAGRDRRARSPLMTVAEWREALAEVGLRSFAHLDVPEPRGNAAVLFASPSSNQEGR